MLIHVSCLCGVTTFPHTLAQRRYLLGRAVVGNPAAGKEPILWEEKARCKSLTNQPQPWKHTIRLLEGGVRSKLALVGTFALRR